MKTLCRVLLAVSFLMPIGLLSQTYDWSWATQAGGPDAVTQGKRIAVDANGNSYVTGFFSGETSFGQFSVTSSGTFDVFVAKTDAEGNYLWVKSAGGSGQEEGMSIAADELGNCYITGYHLQEAWFGSTYLGGSGVFISKLDPLGNWIWTQQVTGNRAQGIDVDIDIEGNVVVTGSFDNSASFGTTILTSHGSDDIFVAKLNPMGGWIWAVNAGGISIDVGFGVDSDTNGNYYVTGCYQINAVFRNLSINSVGYQDVFVAQLSSDGVWQWVSHGGGTDYDYGYDIVLDSNGNIYTTGTFHGNAQFGDTILLNNIENEVFVAKLNYLGEWQWVKKAGGLDQDEGWGIVCDSQDSIFITGLFCYTATFGPFTLTSNGISDVFVSKLDSLGNWLWAYSAGGQDNDTGYGIAIDSTDNCYVTGYFKGTADFGTTMTSFGDVDAFVCKLSPSPFYEIDTNLTGVRGGTNAWGDYDNDGDLDILVTGENANSVPVTKIYRNDGEGTFIDSNIVLVGVKIGAAVWGDYDNDGYLDIIITGLSGNGFVSRIYHNNGSGEFTDINAGLIGVIDSAVAWGDYDNDGDLDILLTGADSDVGNYHSISKIYRNDGNNAFTDILANLPGVWCGSVAWGDCDNDGDLDVLLSGCYDSAGNQYISKVFRNEGSGVFTDINAGLIGVFFSSCAWGDYDNDGDLDVLISGLHYNNSSMTHETASRVYRNDGNGTFIDIAAGLTDVYMGSAAWGDYDNDGDLDILLTGSLQDNSTYYSIIYRNDGNGIFVDIDTNLLGVMYGSAAWGDYDHDMDLDIILTGWSRVDASTYFFNAKIYNNTIVEPNTIPSAPINLRAITVGDYINFEWDAATDAQTPTLGLNYVLRVGTTPGGDDISSPMSLNSGLRLLPEMGYANSSCSWKIRSTALPQSADCYWSVQAIDTAFSGSVFATESIFLPEPILEITPIASINFPDTYLGYYSDISELWIQNTGRDVLTLDSISFMLINSPFEVIGPIIPTQISAGDSIEIHVRYTPQTAGSVSDSLFIYNNSLNLPIARIHLSGRGVVVPPKPPVNLQITIVGNDAVIIWDAVTQTIFDTPISPDYYFIYNANKPEGEFVLNGLTPNLSYTHPYIALGAQRMFYKVSAVKFYRDDLSPAELDSYLKKNITPGMTEADLRAFLHEIN